MKISELITMLNHIHSEYGDLEVWTSGYHYSGDPEPATKAVMAHDKKLDGTITPCVLIGDLDKSVQDGYVI